MPAKSVDQYGLAVATLGGAATQMPLEVAEEIVRKTPKAARMRYAKELAKRRMNPTALTQAMIEGAGFAAGNAIASPLIEIGKEVVKRGFGIAKRHKRNGRNPGSLAQAQDLSEEFHGREAYTETDYEDEFRYDSNLADIGELIELSLWTGKKGYDLPITFNQPRPRLASSADGQQLYIVGGDQSLDSASLKALEKIPIYHDHVGTNRSKRKIPLGTLVVIAYKTDKHHLKGASGGQDTWEHHFGEETSKAPMLVYDTLNRQMEIVGGDYQVKDVGIVN